MNYIIQYRYMFGQYDGREWEFHYSRDHLRRYIVLANISRAAAVIGMLALSSSAASNFMRNERMRDMEVHERICRHMLSNWSAANT